MNSDPSNVKIDAHDVYEMLWRCREFELKTLWQRAVMLVPFVVLSYTGYGALLLAKMTKGTYVEGSMFHFIAAALCLFGMAFAVLWIAMMKGSKGWYERYESALNLFVQRYGASIDLLEKYDAAFGLCHHPDAVSGSPALHNCLLSLSAGRYSPSKVVIGLGVVSMLSWVLLLIAHITVIAIGAGKVMTFVLSYGHVIAAVMMLFGVAIVLVSKKLARSSSL